MNQVSSILNPTLKIALISLDLSLESELMRYKNQTTVKLIQSVPESGSQLSVIVVNSPLKKDSVREKEVTPEIIKLNPVRNIYDAEPIPVAARVVTSKEYILDSWLTPWGMLSVILFLLANGIIFINWGLKSDFQQTTANNTLPIDQTTTKERETSQPLLTNNPNSELEQPSAKSIPSPPLLTQNQNDKTTNSPTLQQTQSKVTQPSATLPPPPPLPSPLPKPSQNTATQQNQNQTYPDLATALLSSPPSQSTKPKPVETKANSPVQQKVSPPKPLPLQQKNNITPVPVPQNIPEPTKISQATLPTPTQPESFYVLADYQNLDSLTEITTIFPSAVITNIEDKLTIQLGKFTNRMEANQLMQSLQSQGINSYVYP
jgi:hypothetical protein